MTIAVLWYREKYDELWCEADSRISNSGKTTTDSGAKVFPIPISCYKQTSPGEWIEYDNFKIGFAFAGSTLAALNSLALVSACTQNLRINHNENKIPTIGSVSDLFRKITEFYIRDISSRAVGTQMSPKSFFFESFVFGYCRREKQYVSFALVPYMDGDGLFNVRIEHMLIEQGKFYTLGSGEEKFLEIHKEIGKTHPDPGVARTFTEMLDREEHPEVGGYCQIGIADKSGFNLVPTIETKRPNRGKVKFLGFDVSSLDCIEDFVVGHRAIGLDT